MCRVNAIPSRLGVVGVVAVILSLLLVNLRGSPDPRPGTLSQQKWVHGWPITWLYRSWHPYISSHSDLNPWHPSWPWVNLPQQQRDFLATAMLVDGFVAVVILLGVVIGLSHTRRAGSFRTAASTALVLLAFLGVLCLLAMGIPDGVAFLADACVYVAAVFAGCSVIAHVRRYTRREGPTAKAGDNDTSGSRQ
jgi:hypothetical protein